MAQTLGDRVDRAIQVAAPMLPMIIIGRQPYLLDRPDTMGPEKRQERELEPFVIYP